ncbi:MAG: TIR domain-containing protein, partial [Nitrososphaera sp.]
MAKKKAGQKHIFDFALSFAGEDRAVASRLAHLLDRSGARVFYDDNFRPFLLGKKLTKEFKTIYGTSTRYVVPIISKYYPEKDWTDFEFSVVKREKGRRKEEFVLPLRLDKTKILGLHEDVGYLNLQRISIKEVAEILLAKIGLELVTRPQWWA